MPENAPPTDPRVAITAAARAEIARLSRLAERLPTLDLDVAAAAVETFDGDSGGAAAWLLAEHHRALPHGSPVELACSEDGKTAVLKVLRGMDRGVLL